MGGPRIPSSPNSNRASVSLSIPPSRNKFPQTSIGIMSAFTHRSSPGCPTLALLFSGDASLPSTGCPKSCGQHWIADIGIEGKKIKPNGQMVDAYSFCVGGSVGQFASIARPVGYRCAATEVPAAIERVLGAFQELRTPAENLRQFFARHSNEEIRAFLAGGFVAGVERDLAAAPTPHGVEG